MRHTRSSSLARLTALAGLLFTAACSSDGAGSAVAPTQPDLTINAAAINGVTTSAEAQVRTVGWLGGLRSDVEVEAAIGPNGGVLRIPRLGFELVVPKGAVTKVTTFKAKALKGQTVAFDFQPHGTKFAVPLTFRQNALYTSVGWGLAIKGGYFTDPTKIDDHGKKAAVAEQMNARWNGTWMEFDIRHFSGYLVSCA